MNFTVEFSHRLEKIRNIKLFIVKWRININMKLKTTYSPVSNLFSKQLNLLDFGFEKPAVKKIKEINKDIKPNKLLKFIKNTFKYSKIVLNKYSSNFSKHDFTQPALFTILAVKIYTKSTYR